jgi:hypothetical protein
MKIKMYFSSILVVNMFPSIVFPSTVNYIQHQSHMKSMLDKPPKNVRTRNYYVDGYFDGESTNLDIFHTKFQTKFAS